MAPALDGITVLDLTRGMAGALATMLLCDNGARVVRIDSPQDGDSRREPGYRIWDRGKESVVLDMSAAMRAVPGLAKGPTPSKAGHPADLHHFDSLVRRADVLVESFAPGSPYQPFVGYDRLGEVNPRLVHCSITAYGKKGPLRDEPPVDELVMARLGVLADALPDFRPGPVHVTHPVPSIGAALLAAQGIVAALFARETSGRGKGVETSLRAGILLMSPRVVGERPPPSNPLMGGGSFYTLYECADGQWIQLACIHEGFVKLAISAMSIAKEVAAPRFGGGFSPRDMASRGELFEIIGRAIRTRPYQEWSRIFEEADVPYARPCTVEEAMDDPQVRFNQMVVGLDDPELGTISELGLPLKLSGTPGEIKGPSPRFGRHTESVLSELSAVAAPRVPFATHRTDGSAIGPLKGIKVLEIGNVIAGPAVAWCLGDLGADVTKLEPLDGDISRPKRPLYFIYLNAGKRSISVNVRTDEGREVLCKLVSGADVLVSNLRPGATDRMGIGAEALKSLNPNLIETHVTGFGTSGPYAHRPGLDPLAQALTGLLRAQGGYGNPPVFVQRLAPTDFTAGALGALGVIMALFVRERAGVAQRVETSLLNAGCLLNADGFLQFGGKPARRLADKELYGLSALRRLYEAADGWIYLVAEEPLHWPPLCAALGLHDLAIDSRYESAQGRLDSDDELAQGLTGAFRTRPVNEVVVRLQEAGVPCAPVIEGHDKGLFSDPQAVANDMIKEHPHSGYGPMSYSHGLIRFIPGVNVVFRATPLLGEHTREVLSEIGYPHDRIDVLYDKGIVKTEEPPAE